MQCIRKTKRKGYIQMAQQFLRIPRRQPLGRRVWMARWFYILMLPGLAYFLIYRYLPMFGIAMAFQDYNPTLDKVINIFDRLADQEMCNLLALGVEGKNYEVVNGVAHMLPDEDGSIKNFYTNSIYNPYTVPMAVRWPNLRTIPAELDYGAKRNLEIIEENAPYAVADPTLGLTSELYLELGPDLDTLLGDAKVLYIMGQIDRDEYLKRVEQWRAQGGDDIAADYARLYEEKNG